MPRLPTALLLLASGLSCAPPPKNEAPSSTAAASAPPSRCTPPARRAALDAFLGARRADYTTALGKARGFLDGLEVDPIALRAMHLKGKKKLVEALDAYYRLYLVAPAEARPALVARVTALARPTQDDRYHDLLLLADKELKEDATSYLRAALLLDRMGVDITRYRVEIQSARWRLDAQMKDRGPHQRRAFHTYYQHFGLPEPFPLAGALDKGLIAARADPEKLSRLDVYAVTHEVFTAYDFGDALDAEPFTDPDRGYLRSALGRLVSIWMGKRDPDLVAELVACLRYAQLTGEPAYVEGLDYLLRTQNDDGSWGDYEASRRRLGDLVKQGFYLHTTMVGIEALTAAFEERFRKGEAAVCR